jgi:hypothetical protein
LAVPILFLLALAGRAAAESKDDSKKPVKSGPLELRVVAQKDAYTLDLGGKTPKEFRQYLDELSKKNKKGALDFGKQLPAAPAVDLVLEIRNTSDKEATALVGGDYTLTLELTGPGVVKFPYNAAYTADIKFPKTNTLGPGKGHSIPLKALEDGFRGYGRRLYWTEPGEYTLTARYAIRGQGKEKPDQVLSSAPIKLKVSEPAGK